jgi:DNA-binding CsgD family transcriptional regulator
MKHDDLMQACDRIDEAALLGAGWAGALETLARAAGSRGAMIMHNKDQRLVSYVSDDSIAEPINDYMAGKAPPNARQTKILHDFDPGFRLDYDDFESRAIARDPYYQDFLRPLGMHWHANARLMLEGTDEIAISFKRELRHGHYDAADRKMLDRIVPRLRSAAYTAECIFDAETRGLVRAVTQRGRPVVEFDARGRVRRLHGDFDGFSGPLAVRGHQVFAAQPHLQKDLLRAIDRAVTPPRRQASIVLDDRSGQRYLLQVIPVTGQARDVFLATSAIGVVIGRPVPGSLAFDMDIARELFQLSFREAQIAALVCDCCTTMEIAARLSIVPETVRFHLKAIFDKTGARKRSDIVSIMARLAH